MLLKQPNFELPVAFDHSQLGTIASEMVDPIYWQLLHTLNGAVPPELHVLHDAKVFPPQ